MLGISFLNEYGGELFCDEGRGPWIIRLRAVDVLSRLRARWRWQGLRVKPQASVFDGFTPRNCTSYPEASLSFRQPPLASVRWMVH